MSTSVQTSNELSAHVEHTSSHALASLLLAAGVSALVVGAGHLMEPWADHHALAAWVALWAIAVLAILALRGATRILARQAMHGLDAWSARLAQRRADQRLWAMAQTDARLMGDLQAALDREQDGPAQDVLTLTQRRAQRIVHRRLHYI